MPTSNFQPIKLLDPDFCYTVTYLMANSADPDQLTSSEANWSGSTLFAGRVYPGSAGQRLILTTLPMSNSTTVMWPSWDSNLGPLHMQSNMLPWQSNNRPSFLGHFVSFPREREKMDTRASRCQEKEKQRQIREKAEDSGLNNPNTGNSHYLEDQGTEIPQNIHISTYQICTIEEKIIHTSTFQKWICYLAPEVRNTLKIFLFSTIFCYLLLDFHVWIGTRFSHRDKRLFVISKVEIVDYIEQ